jgi:flavodoxin
MPRRVISTFLNVLLLLVSSMSHAENVSRPNVQKTSTLVVYFSCSGVTSRIANEMAKQLKADIYEIKPTKPYTDADLDYRDDNSRSTIEQNNLATRPEIAIPLANLDQYKSIILGYPIWWGEAPRIVSTFVSSYDFSGKHIIPFCTSGSSGVGSSVTQLKTVTKGEAKWESGIRLKAEISDKEIATWLTRQGLLTK